MKCDNFYDIYFGNSSQGGYIEILDVFSR